MLSACARAMALSVPGRGFHAARAMATKASHTYHMLLYDFVTDMESKRGPTRGAHLEYLDDLTKKGKLAMAGALVDPVDAGLLIFRNCTKEEVETIAREDPYTTGGLVTGWKVRKYAKVQGDAE